MEGDCFGGLAMTVALAPITALARMTGPTNKNKSSC
jgi:hypothetical protein